MNISKLNGCVSENSLNMIRNLETDLKLQEKFRQWSLEGENTYSYYEYVCIWILTKETNKDTITWYIQNMKKYYKKEFEEYTGYLFAIWNDLRYFPVPESLANEKAEISFRNSWMSPRTFGGKRGHEGTDLMAKINHRGRYPIVSITDGVIEQVGWLPQGGYRLGIRAPHGGYFYYAHLSDYAKDFKIGDPIAAGEWIGFMGDSGYSQVEGTVGNFDVHLHLGIYITTEDGELISVNSFGPLKYLETRKLKYKFY